MRKKKILLIEDDNWLAESYRDILVDYTVDIIKDGYEAIDYIDKNNYVAVVADVMVEWGNTIDLLHELQSYADTKQLPVILCTNLARTIALKDVEAYGVVSILDKMTVTPKKMRDEIKRVL